MFFKRFHYFQNRPRRPKKYTKLCTHFQYISFTFYTNDIWKNSIEIFISLNLSKIHMNITKKKKNNLFNSPFSTYNKSSRTIRKTLSKSLPVETGALFKSTIYFFRILFFFPLFQQPASTMGRRFVSVVWTMHQTGWRYAVFRAQCWKPHIRMPSGSLSFRIRFSPFVCGYDVVENIAVGFGGVVSSLWWRKMRWKFFFLVSCVLLIEMNFVDFWIIY